MARTSVQDIAFSAVFPLLIQKAERKGRSREEVVAVTAYHLRRFFLLSSSVESALGEDHRKSLRGAGGNH